MTNEEKAVMHTMLTNMIKRAKETGDLVITDESMVIKGNHPGSRGLIVMVKSLAETHGAEYTYEDNCLEITHDSFANCYVLQKLTD